MIERGIMDALHRAQEKGDKKAIAQAEALSSVLKAVKLDGFKDVPLPKQETQVVEIKRFPAEAKQFLEKEGYQVHELTGQSIASLRDSGRKFWSSWHKDYPEFEALESIQSEVAINPNPKKFFLPKSNNATLNNQLEMVAEHSYKLQRRLKDQSVEAVLGQAPDYVDLAFTHLDATGDFLFGEKYDYNYTRTQTPTVGPRVAGVGGFSAGYGLNVGRWDRGYGTRHVFASPLVVPK